MADGLLTSIQNALQNQYQTTKRGLGLLVNDPAQFGREAVARYFPTPEEVAQQRALEQSGGIAMNTPYMEKMFNLGQFQGSIKAPGLLQSTRPLFDEGWYHGTTGDIRQFRKDLLGEATKAKSAEEGFFFARDPRNPPVEMTQKSNDPEIIAMLKRAGKTDAEIAAMNTVSMKGHGAHTASGYAQIGGDREYREAMRLASIAEKKRNWPEYEKQSAIAENLALAKNNQLQLLTAKHGEARDQMIEDVAKSLNISSMDAYGSGVVTKNALPYAWWNDPKKIQNIKQMLSGKEGSDTAIKAIENYKSIVAQRLAEESASGANVLPVALRYKNPMYYDFKGSAYRDQTYADLVKEAKAKGHDALILQNTYDPGAGTAKLIDVGVVFEPNQVRSKFAKFDPANINSPDLLAAGVPLGLLAGTEVDMPKKQQKKPKK